MFFLRSLVSILISSLVFSPSINYAQQVSVLGLPKPGTMVSLSSSYVPVMVKGLHIHPENPILFDFILDTGDSGLDAASPGLRSESEKLIKYFLASLTIPEGDLWVNLSPYEKSRIIPEQLGQTVMGRDMLGQDYVLKQLTASLIYPEKNLGKEFWSRVYTRSQQLFGSREIPVNTFNKVWIVADKAKVYVHDNTAFVVASHMKVMLEEDYLAMYKHGQSGVVKPTNSIGSQVVREIILPELEKEVNRGKNFANLRQIFNSMILAAWYKKSLKESLLNQVYSNKAKIKGIDVQDKTIKEQIYQEYLKAYKKGVFNYIKEDMQADGQSIPRKYFSGGEVFNLSNLTVTTNPYDHDVAMFAPRGKFISELVTTPSNAGTSLKNQGPRRDYAMSVVGDLLSRGNYVSDHIGKDDTFISKIKSATEFLDSQQYEYVTFNQADYTVLKLSPEQSELFKMEIYKGRLYINQSFLDQLNELQNSGQDHFDLFTRTLIQTIISDQWRGYHAQYSYAQSFNESETKELGESDFDGIYKRLLSSQVGRMSPEGLEEKINSASPVKGFKYRVLQSKANSDTKRGADLFAQSIEEGVYHIAVNAMDGKMDLRNKARVSEDEPVEKIKGKEIKVGTLAAAMNPTTDAHVVLAAVKSMAESELGDFLILVTQGDHRKPALEATAQERYAITKAYFEYIFGKNGMIRVAPMEEGNGEDKLLRLADLNKEAEKLEIGYGAGGDHFRAFAGIKFQAVTDDNKKDIVYYARLPGYKDILRRLDIHLKAIKAIAPPSLQTLINGNPVSLINKGGIDVPVLDTVSKLFLIGKQLKKNKINAALEMICISRGAALPDSIRDDMIENNEVGVVFNEGIEVDVSSTLIRKAVVEFFKTGIINYDSFAFLPVEIIQSIFAPEHRPYLYFLARLQGAELPQALILMDPLQSKAEKDRRDALSKNVMESFRTLGLSSLTFQDRITGNESKISVMERDKEILSITYRVQERLDLQSGQAKTILNSDTVLAGGVVEGAKVDQIIEVMKDYIERLNGVRTDQAMLISQPEKPETLYGGIDFNSTNFDLEETGEKINASFDPGMIEQFQRGDFSGVVPVIIRITPIEDPWAMLRINLN
jgi:hypothetical protein